MGAELELEKQRSMTEEAQKTRRIEAGAICLEVEAESLENGAHGPDSLQQRLKDFEDEESAFVSPRQEISKEVKHVHALETPCYWMVLICRLQHAANNLDMVVDKLPHSLCVKRREYRREKELKHATPLDFEKGIELPAEVYIHICIHTLFIYTR